jgi:hypothetical protein
MYDARAFYRSLFFFQGQHTAVLENSVAYGVWSRFESLMFLLHRHRQVQRHISLGETSPVHLPKEHIM